jgi:hypothetical protein
MDDTFEEVSDQSWGNRLSSSIQGILVGILLFGGGVYLLQWNEGRFVKRYRAIEEGEGVVIDVNAYESINGGNDAKLIHFTGKTVVKSNVTDDIFGVTSNDGGTIKLRRSVQMYQWIENEERIKEKKLGGGTKTTTKYSYTKAWTNSLVDSADFKQPSGHGNPSDFPFKSRTFTASDVDVGNIKISPEIISKFNWYSYLQVDTNSIPDGSIKDSAQNIDRGFFVSSNFGVAGVPHVIGTPMNPQVGDVKVHFDVVLNAEVSIIAKQTQNSIAPYTTTNGNSLFLYMLGNHTADEMFAHAEKSNEFLAWVLRFVGCAIIYFGLKVCMEPLVVVMDCLPFFGDLVESGIEILAAILAFVISSLVIVIAWIMYRPMFIFGLIIIIVAVMTAGIIFAKKNKKAKYSNSFVETPVAYQTVYPMGDDNKWTKHDI